MTNDPAAIAANCRILAEALLDRMPPSREADAKIAAALHPEWRISRDRYWSDGNHDTWCIRRDGRVDLPCNEALPALSADKSAAIRMLLEKANTIERGLP